MSEAEDFEFRMRMEQEAADSQEATASTEPSALAVAGNAAAKGVAGMVDMFGNAPANLLNVGKYVAGDTMEKLGHPIWDQITPTEQPNLAQKGLTALGLIKPENEPQTPGQRILDMAVQSGVGVAASPASGVAGVLRNAATGLASGAAAGVTKELTGSDLAAIAVGAAVPMVAGSVMRSTANAPTLKNPVKTETLRDAQAAGYIVPPSQVKPSATTNKLEGVAGKAAVRQEASIRNQEVTNQLAAKSLGLPPETMLTESSLTAVRNEAGKSYDAVAQLSPVAASALQKLKEARQQATLYFKHYDRSADPASLTKAKNANAESSLLERAMEREAKKAGQPELIADLKSARTMIAKSYDIERALNVGDGNVSAHVLGRLLDQGKPLSGELKVIGKFAQAFPSVTRPGAMVPASGVSGTDAAASAMLGTLGYGAMGGPTGLVAAGLPLLRSPARAALLSKGYQNRLLKTAPGLDQAMLKSVLAGRAVAESP